MSNFLIRPANPTYNLCQLCYETVHIENGKTKMCVSCYNEKAVPRRNWCKKCIEDGKSNKWCRQCHGRFANDKFGFCKKCYSSHLTNTHKSGLCNCCGIKLSRLHFIVCANCNIAGQTACFYHGFGDCICFATEIVPFCEFCNSYEAHITIDNITFKTMEHYYQANKFNNDAIFMQIVNCVYPELIHKIVEMHKKHINPEFDKMTIR